jgi:hypothetical protein
MNFAGITLLNGGLALGLLSVVLPTLIHLLSRRRARRVRFAPMELLLRSQKRTARSIRLRQFVLLLVRTLFFLAIAAALLRPLLLDDSSSALSSAPTVVVFAVDASASMQARVDGVTSFERARDKARERLGSLPDDVRVGVVACEAEARDLVAPTFDRAAAAAALDALAVGATYADVAACVARAGALAVNAAGLDNGADDATTKGNAEGERRVTLISDLAAHGFPRGPATEAPGLRVELVQVGDDTPPPNHGITDVNVAATSQGMTVHFNAARFGGSDAEVIADLFVDAARGPRLQLPFSSSAQRLERTFTAPSSTSPSSTISVALDDDALPLDNVVVLAHEERPRLKVLIVDGEPDAVPFADEVHYLTQALSSSRMGAAGQSRLDVSVMPPEKLDATSLVGIDVVVLANVARLEDAAAAALVSHVSAGAGLFIACGDQMDVDAWNRSLGAVLPAVLRGSKQQALLDDAAVDDVLGLSRFATEHPVLRAFAGSSTDALPGLTRVRTRASMLVEPDPNVVRPILARFSNDAPALMERAVGPSGQGRVLLLTTSVDREWTDLPIRPGFLPLMEQVVLYLGRALDDGRPRTARVGQIRTIHLPPDADAAVVTLPDGRQVTVERGTEPDPAGSAHNDHDVTFTDTTQVGLYGVAARSKDVRTPLPGERFTVLMDPREMDLRHIDDGDLKDVLPTGATIRRDRSDRPGEPLWPWLLLAAVAFLLVEATLVRRGDRAP